MSYSYSENHYYESKDQEEETVLEEIMRKAAIGRYVVYYLLVVTPGVAQKNEMKVLFVSYLFSIPFSEQGSFVTRWTGRGS